MAESHHDKTEQPTYRKQQKARSKGQVVKSSELQSAIVILSGILALRLLAPWMNTQLLEKFVESLSQIGDTTVTADAMPGLLMAWLRWGAVLLSPMLLLLAVAAISGALLIQGGIVYSTDALAPNLERLNPITGAQRLFSTRILFNLFRDVLKIMLIGLVCYLGVKEAIFVILNRADIALSAALSQVGGFATSIGLKAGGVLLVIGIMDYAYQKRQYIKDLKMTKKEVKDEMKESEGDPIVKGRLKSQQKDMARKRMMQAVPEADVVLTNPTHIAVALKYDAASMSAPQVVAKGQRLIAEKIKEIARAHNIPIIEDKPLARSLFKLAPVGGEIPVDLYRAVAEVLSYVYKLQGKKPLLGD